MYGAQYYMNEPFDYDVFMHHEPSHKLMLDLKTMEDESEEVRREYFKEMNRATKMYALKMKNR
jgi:hypothetical protein